MFLLITEKSSPACQARDGGFQLVETLKSALGGQLHILQFGETQSSSSDTTNYCYPHHVADRFERRMLNADFIAQRVFEHGADYTIVIFAHISMQFGFRKPFDWKQTTIWTFPMFLTESYRLSGERVPIYYTQQEQLVLSTTDRLLTPSHFEKQQLLNRGVSNRKIYVIPRGIDRQAFQPTKRQMGKSLNFCSVGSIKQQKNTLELIDVFAKINQTYPHSTLRIIGSAQCLEYKKRVIAKINSYNIIDKVTLLGYLPTEKISAAVRDCHIHLSCTSCETFGRSLFETLAMGLPNITNAANNAAKDYLNSMPSISFVKNNEEYLHAVRSILENYERLSEQAADVGFLFDNQRLAKRLVATITERVPLIISDFDGTLFHKTDPEKTRFYIEQFHQYSLRILCSARSLDDLINQALKHQLSVDWFIGYSGAVIANAQGEVKYLNPLTENEINTILQLLPQAEIISFDKRPVQVLTSSLADLDTACFNVETYQGMSYIANWRSTKLRSLCYLLDMLNWSGQINSIGDGIYDRAYIQYFDGQMILAEPTQDIAEVF